MNQEQINKAFNTLVSNYSSTKCFIYDDAIVYHSLKNPYQTQDELNALILEHDLPLVAKNNVSNGLFFDSVLVTVKA